MKIFKQVMIGLLVMFLIVPALALTVLAAGNKAEGKSPQVNEKSAKMVYNETMEKPGRQKAVDSKQFDHETPHGPNQSGHPGSTTTAPSAAIPGADNLVNTYYIYSYDGKLLCEYDHNGNCVKNYIYIGNRLLAEYHPQTDKYYYYTLDQVNSTRVITDDNGNVVYSAAHGPYGQIQKTWTNTYDPKLKYSGKEREGYSGLDYFGARYYDHQTYRFNSPDPIFNRAAALSNPQLWNGYSYCRNNPITFRDPDGRMEFDYLADALAGQYLDRHTDISYKEFVQLSDQCKGLGAFAGLTAGALAAASPQIAAATGPLVEKYGDKIKNQIYKLSRLINGNFREALNYALKDNKIKHYFQTKHGLQGLIEKFGSEANVVREVLNNLGKISPDKNGLFNVVRNIGGTNVRITGRVINGVPKIGDMWNTIIER